MENRNIDSTITVVGVTLNEGIVLLATQNATSSSRCVTFIRESNLIAPLDSVAQATGFNAFEPVEQDRSSNMIALFNQQLSQEQIDTINNHLTHE
jgi:hypothetical protein